MAATGTADGFSITSQGPSTLASLLGLIVLGYYALIWSLCLLGLSQARSLFGRPPNRHNARLPVLPLRHATGHVPTSPPMHSGATVAGAAERVGVSILRPLAGLDHNLASNLASAFEQRYPRDLFEIILSVRDETDQALPVARRICARYPEVQSRIIVGDEVCGVNPKICNLVRPYAAAQFDIVWVIDAQVQVSPYALGRAVDALQAKPRTPAPTALQRQPHGGPHSRVGLAHHVPLGVTPHSTSMGSHIEAIFLSTNHAKMYLAINALSLESCVMGKSNLYRKSDLACVPDSFFKVSAEGTRGEAGAIGSIAFQANEAAGDQSVAQDGKELVSNGPARPLARFGIYLAEDNMLATSLWRPPLNLAHTVIAKDVARTSVGEVKSLGDYWKRRVRWIRVRRHMVPAATYIEPFTESLLCGVIATIALLKCWLPWLGIVETGLNGSQAGRNLLGVCFFLVHLLAWHLVDFAVLASLQSAGHEDEPSVNTGSSSAGSGARPSPLLNFDDSQSVLKFRLAWLGRELLALPIWTVALCDNTVTWRSRKFRILSDSRAAHLEVGAAGSSRWWRAPVGQFASHGRYERISGQSDDA